MENLWIHTTPSSVARSVHQYDRPLVGRGNMVIEPIGEQSGTSGNSGSWTSLVAATTPGLDGYSRTRVHVRVTQLPELAQSRTFRLVVQTYAAGSLMEDGTLAPRARPLGATLRALSWDQLTAGLHLDLVHLYADVCPIADCVFFAWVEPGEANLEFDGLAARPTESAVCSVSSPVSDVPRSGLIVRRDAA